MAKQAAGSRETTRGNEGPPAAVTMSWLVGGSGAGKTSLVYPRLSKRLGFHQGQTQP